VTQQPLNGFLAKAFPFLQPLAEPTCPAPFPRASVLLITAEYRLESEKISQGNDA
jgi:hypothetical protein